MIKVRGRELDVDVLEELEHYEWNRARVKPDEMVSCSPFRNESTPSFSINLTTGQWIDFGANDDLYNKGSLVSLLAFLGHETQVEAEDYLIEKYSLDLSDVENRDLKINIQQEESESKIITLEDYKKFGYRHGYLGNRGISEHIQKAFKIGYDKRNNAVAFPWMDKDGNIINVKFRSIKSKQFYYWGGDRIKNHLYGIHFVFKYNLDKIYLVESEVDALYMWSHGFYAIALGGSNLSKNQQKLLMRSPATTLILATDNDETGQRIREDIKKKMRGYMRLEEIHLPYNVKDVNDLSGEELKKVATVNDDLKISIFK